MNNLIYSDPNTLLFDQNKCIEILADALKYGSLNLIIGAGVSQSTKKDGFPSWAKLTNSCCKKTSIVFDDNQSSQNKYLLAKLESVRKSCLNKGKDFSEIVKESLYENIEFNIDLLKTDLLIAIGALVMNSSKSNLANVINYNFDDLLEWYLTFYGFDIQVISDSNHLITSSDVNIYHPHGFLPKCERFVDFNSDKIILSNRDYVEAGWNTDFWNSIQHNILSNKINLFIGMSGEDPHVESLCQYSYDKIIGKNRLLGIMVLSLKNKNETIEQQNLSNGIVTYYISDHSELPDLLLKISRQARGII